MTQRSSQSGTPPSFQDECEAYLEAVGGVGPGGSVFGLGSAASDYYSDRITAPRRQASRVADMQRENLSLRAEVTQLRENQAAQAAQIQALQQFMEEMRANRAPPSTSNAAPPNDPDHTN